MTQKKLRALFDYDVAGFLKLKTTGRRAGWQRPLPTPRRHVQIEKKVFYEHRLIFCWHHGFMPKLIDHINGNGIDNRIENLRAATPSQNLFNSKRPANNRSGTKGVHYCRTSQTWVARICVGGKRKQLGRFILKPEAIRARKIAERALHGNFARQEEALFI